MKVTDWIEILKQIFQPKFRDALVDPRTQVEKNKDYKYGEDILLARGSTNKRIKKLPFVAYKQGGTSACGAFSASHARKLVEAEDTFAPIWYRSRTNYHGEGMFLKDVLKLAAFADKVVAPKEVPAKFTEQWANNLPPIDLFVNERGLGYEYIQINAYDADAVFDAVSNGHATIIGFYSTLNEWDEEMIPKDVTTLYSAAVHHFVVCLPNSTHEKDGFEWVSIVDSSPQKGFSLRHIRKDFLKQRMYLGAGFYYKIDTKEKKVSSVPTTRVEYGQRNDGVLELQKFLLQLGLVNKNHLTGYYGNITAAAVLKWQLANIQDPNTAKLKGYYWGPKSITTANTLYSK